MLALCASCASVFARPGAHPLKSADIDDVQLDKIESEINSVNDNLDSLGINLDAAPAPPPAAPLPAEPQAAAAVQSGSAARGRGGGGVAAGDAIDKETDATDSHVDKELDAAMGAEADIKLKNSWRRKPQEWQTSAYKRKFDTPAMLKNVESMAMKAIADGTEAESNVDAGTGDCAKLPSGMFCQPSHPSRTIQCPQGDVSDCPPDHRCSAAPGGGGGIRCIRTAKMEPEVETADAADSDGKGKEGTIAVSR